MMRVPGYPARIDIVIRQGDDMYYSFTLRAGGLLLPLSGHSARAQVRADVDDEDALISLTSAGSNGGITLGPQGGGTYNILMHIPASITSELDDWGQGGWDLELTDDNDDVTTHFGGNATLYRTVTR